MSNLVDRDNLAKCMQLKAKQGKTYGYLSAEEIKDYINNFPLGQQWISVKERLPDKNGDYLATIKYTIYDQTKFMIVVKSYFGDQDWQDGFVVAWMELPEIYTENNNKR